MALSWFVVKNDKEFPYIPNKFTIKEAIAEKPEKFVLYDTATKIPVHILHLDDSRKKLIYVRRIDMQGGRGFKVICHICGWQMKVGGESIQAINYIFETQGKSNGDMVWVESAGKFQEKHEWFYSPSEEQMVKVLGIGR